MVQQREKPNYVLLFKSVSPEGKDELWVLQPGLIFFSKGLLFNISLRYFENLMGKNTVCLTRVFLGVLFKSFIYLKMLFE